MIKEEKNKSNYTSRLLKMDNEHYEMLRKWSFIERRSISSLVRECLEDKLKNMKNVLTRADI